MKVSFPENEALFGIDHDGEKRWYCWRLPHGCRGKLGRFLAGIKDTDFPWPMVEIGAKFHFQAEAWRINHRGKSREKGGARIQRLVAKHQHRDAAQCAEQVKQEGTHPTQLDTQLEMDGRTILARFQHLAEASKIAAHNPHTHVLSSKGIKPGDTHGFPARIECPACGALNRIPSPQGALKVRAGAVLPTCTDKRA
jgi:hypothetical protein